MNWPYFALSMMVSLSPLSHAATKEMPKVLVEASVQPASSPVNAQLTYSVRVLHSVDIGRPEFSPPVLRLAEVFPLAPLPPREIDREGVRYRVQEGRFAIVPFASGELTLLSQVTLRSPAGLAALGGQSAGALSVPLARALVLPVDTKGFWLPARKVTLTEDGAAPVVAGHSFSRTYTIEAFGVVGAGIPALKWPSSADWVATSDPPEVSTQIAGESIVGRLRQTVHFAPLRTGAGPAPAGLLAWWDVFAARQAQLILEAPNAGTPSGASPGAVIANHAASDDGIANESRRLTIDPMALSGLVALIVILMLSRVFRHCLRELLLMSRARRKAFSACRAGDPLAASKALLEWARISGCPASSIGQLIERTDDTALRSALADLEAVLYGATKREWQGQNLARTLPGSFWRPRFRHPGSAHQSSVAQSHFAVPSILP